MKNSKPNINISFIGQTYTGKSTIISNLIHGLGDSDTLNKLDPFYERLNSNNSISTSYLKNYRYRLNSMQTRYLSLFQINTKRASLTLIDTPGEKSYLRTMITGIILSDVAILVTPSSTSELDLEHPRFGMTMYQSFFALALGAEQSIICINKISEKFCSLTESEYQEMKMSVIELFSKIQLSIENVLFIPVSSSKKQNILEPSAEFEWYKGPTLFEALSNLVPQNVNTEKPLRIIVYDIFKKQMTGLVVGGLIISGSLSIGQTVVFAPSGVISKVESIEILKKRIDVGVKGDIVGFYVRNVRFNDVKKGFVVSDLKNDPARECECFSAEITVLNHPEKIKVGYSPIITIHTLSTTCKFVMLQKIIDKETGATLETEPDFLKAGNSAMVIMSPINPMCVETFDDYPKLGRFVITDKGRVIALGRVKEVLNKI